MSRKNVILLLLPAVTVLAVYLLWPSDEARIRKLIMETAAAAEAGDLEGVMAAVSFNYSDNHGMSYLLLKKALERELTQLSGIEVQYENLVVEVAEDKAGASMDLRVIATMEEQRGYFLGDFDNPFVVALKLGKNSAGKWRVTGAEYREVW